MKSSTVLVGLIALLPGALAATCVPNELYCGSYLVRVRHWSADTLNNHIKNSDRVPHNVPYQDVLFKCSPDGLEATTDKWCQCTCIGTGEFGENDRCSGCF